MFEFITGPSGSGKTTLMNRRIKSFADKGVQQCIIVPEQYSYDFDKKLYESIGAADFNELFSLSFTSLARELFQLYGQAGRKGEFADDYAKMILIYQAISSVQGRPEALNFFRRQSSHSGFADEVLSLISDMKRAGICPQDLQERSALLDDRLMDKTNDIAAIYMDYQRLLEKYGFKDHLENIRRSAEIAALNGYFKGKTVCLDEFESFTGDQLEMIKVMIASADNVVMTLRTDDVNAGELTLFETVNSTYSRICQICREQNVAVKVTALDKSFRFTSPDLEYLSSHIMRNFHYTPEEAPEPERIRIFEARDMYSEAEYVCATIRRLIFEDRSLMCRDIAIVSNDIAQYGEVLKAAFARYGIPYFFSLEKSVDHTSVMTYFTSLLDLLTARKLRTEQIFRMVKCGVLGISPIETSLLENYCYKWGVDGDMWCEPFTAQDEALSKIEELRKSIIDPVIKLKKKLSRKSAAADICATLYKHLEDCGAEREIGRLMAGLIENERDTEAVELKRLWGCLMEILDSVAETLGSEELTFSEAARMMKSMAGRLKYSLPPQNLDGVMAASARTARLSSPRVVFVMGCTDGSFPNQVSVHGLFSEADRLKLHKLDIDISRPLSDLIASERLIVYKSLSAASERLYLTYPLSDLSGQASFPSPVIDQTMSMFGRSEMLITEDSLTPDYYAVTRRSAYYHFIREMRSGTAETASIKKVLSEDPEYSGRIARVITSSRHKHDYRIDPGIMEQLKDFSPLRLSPTALETYNKCPFSYFCGSVLGLKSFEEMDMDARIAGDLTHACLSSIMSSRSKSDFIAMSYGQLSGEIKENADKYRETHLAGDFGKTPQFRIRYDKITQRLTEVFVFTQQALMQSSFVPTHFEYDLRKEHPAVIDLGSGRSISFGGVIDRVDTCESNGRKYVSIIDYKSSRKTINPRTLSAGVNLQMLIYLFAATEKGAPFEGYVPSGVLYAPVSVPSMTPTDAKDPEKDSSAIEPFLRHSGLILADKETAGLMENGLGGRFIPAKLKKDGDFYDNSSIITEEGLARLKELVYSELKEMAEGLLSGNAEASPMEIDSNTPCKFCDYSDICGNADTDQPRHPSEEKAELADEILGMKGIKGKEEE